MVEAKAIQKERIGRVLSRRLMDRESRKRQMTHPMAPKAPDMGAARPKVRQSCTSEMRPCPWVRCRHHLFLEVKGNGNLQFNHGLDGDDVAKMRETCSLDVAADGAKTLDECATLFGGITKERIRQEQDVALEKLAKALKADGIENSSALMPGCTTYVGSPQDETLKALGLYGETAWLKKLWERSLKATGQMPW